MRQRELDVARRADGERNVGPRAPQIPRQPDHVAAMRAGECHALDSRIDEIAVVRRLEIDDEGRPVPRRLQGRGEHGRHPLGAAPDQRRNIDGDVAAMGHRAPPGLGPPRVIPAKAGIHKHRPCKMISDCGYGSPLSRERLRTRIG